MRCCGSGPDQKPPGHDSALFVIDLMENRIYRNRYERGVADGRAESAVKVLRALLKKRFGRLPVWAQKRLDEATAEHVETWSLKVLDARKVEDVLGKHRVAYAGFGVDRVRHRGRLHAVCGARFGAGLALLPSDAATMRYSSRTPTSVPYSSGNRMSDFTSQ